MFTLAKFVGKTVRNIANLYRFPYLPWQLGSFLFVLHCPRLLRQEQQQLSCIAVAGIFALMFEINFTNGTSRFKNVNNCLYSNIYSYVGTSGSQSSNLYLNVVHVFNTSFNKTSVAA